jgi:hypothetical protein
LEAIDDDFDGVAHLAVEFEVVGELNQRAINSGAKKTLLEEVLEEVAVFAFLPLNERGENEITRAVGEQGDSINDLIEGLGLDRLLAFGAASLADSGVEDAEIVVDFGDGADGTAGVASAGFLLDGDRGGQPGDGIDLGLGHLAEELPSVAGERLDVAALAFSVESVEGEGTFSGATDSGHDDQLVAGKRETDVTEVMLPRPANDDFLLGHESNRCS